MRCYCSLVVVFLTFTLVKAQDPIVEPVDVVTPKTDTIAQPAYINKGKIAGRKAVIRALTFPGLGQLYNYGLIVNDIKTGEVSNKQVFNKVYTLAKFAGVYTAGTLLALSYMDNNRLYKLYLTELQYRALNNNQRDPNSTIPRNNELEISNLTDGKNIVKRNREIVLISFVGVYGIAALEAYVSARLRYFNVDETLSFQVAPSTINSNTMYGYNNVPALKLTLRL